MKTFFSAFAFVVISVSSVSAESVVISGEPVRLAYETPVPKASLVGVNLNQLPDCGAFAPVTGADEQTIAGMAMQKAACMDSWARLRPVDTSPEAINANTMWMGQLMVLQSQLQAMRDNRTTGSGEMLMNLWAAMDAVRDAKGMLWQQRNEAEAIRSTIRSDESLEATECQASLGCG